MPLPSRHPVALSCGTSPMHRSLTTRKRDTQCVPPSMGRLCIVANRTYVYSLVNSATSEDTTTAGHKSLPEAGSPTAGGGSGRVPAEVSGELPGPRAVSVQAAAWVPESVPSRAESESRPLRPVCVLRLRPLGRFPRHPRPGWQPYTRLPRPRFPCRILPYTQPMDCARVCRTDHRKDRRSR